MARDGEMEGRDAWGVEADALGICVVGDGSIAGAFEGQGVECGLVPISANANTSFRSCQAPR